MFEYFINNRAWKFQQLATQTSKNEYAASILALTKFDATPEKQHEIEMILTRYCEYCKESRDRFLRGAQHERDGTYDSLRRDGVSIGPSAFPNLLAELKAHNSLMRTDLQLFLGVAVLLCDSRGS